MTSTRLKLKPFSTPNFVIAEMPPRPRQEGLVESPKFTLAEVDADSLSEMCDQYRAEIFRKAGKDDPRHAAQPEDTGETAAPEVCPKCGMLDPIPTMRKVRGLPPFLTDHNCTPIDLTSKEESK